MKLDSKHATPQDSIVTVQDKTVDLFYLDWGKG